MKMVRISDWPQLQFMGWNRPLDDEFDEETAYLLYKRGWDWHICPEELDDRERDLIKHLIAEFGDGTFDPWGPNPPPSMREKNLSRGQTVSVADQECIAQALLDPPAPALERAVERRSKLLGRNEGDD
jgi:hypothetical protein